MNNSIIFIYDLSVMPITSINELDWYSEETCFVHCVINAKNTNMKNLLYIIAVILILGWAIGFFAYSAGGIIHILLIIAIIAILLNVIRGGKVL
jgi:hypothetical protein